MIQEPESTTWDPRYIYREPSTSLKIYVLYLFVVCIVASVKLVQVWRAASPFRLSRKAGRLSRLSPVARNVKHQPRTVDWVHISWLGN
jgi:hypothetical protein